MSAAALTTRSLDSAEGNVWTVTAVTELAVNDETPAASLPRDIPATVPGVVHTDLLDAELIADPYLDLNELADDWIGHTTWRYRTTFNWPGSEHDRTDLVFDGLDTVATIRLNGTELGSTANQHRSYRFDATALLQLGENELEVTFASAWEYAERLQSELGPLPNAYPTPFNFIRKMAANFGWDWGPQLVTAGIWRPVRLESWTGARIADWGTEVTLDGGDGIVTVTASIERTDVAAAQQAQLTLEVAGQRVAAPVVGEQARLVVRVPHPELWWPHGLGAQPLSELTLSLALAGHPRDERARRIGFRKVELDSSEDADGRRFTVVVNDRPIFIRGANWIPDDCFPSRIGRDRYRQRIEQAVGANLNLLRVWGGGIYESDDFYELCDELGVMTWQDFLFACAAYPEEEPIRSEITAEVRDNVLRIAGHPSLVLWNGCNENIWGWFDWGWQGELGDRTWGLGYYTELLPELLAELDLATPYWAASPFSGSMAHHANEPSRGNMHIWDVWNQVDYTEYARYRPRFVSEFGFQGPPTWSTLTRAIHDEPLTSESPGMLLHQKAADGNGKLERGMTPHLPAPGDIQEWHYLTQLNQSRAIVFGIEHFRALSPLCMGTVVWQLNDCWPVTSWAAVDGDGRRKPLWHGLRRANDPRLLTVQPTAQGALELIAVNDTDEPWTLEAAVSRRSIQGDILEHRTLSLQAEGFDRASVDLGQLGAPVNPESEYLVVSTQGRRPIVHTFVEDRDLLLAPAQVSVIVGEWRSGKQQVILSADSFARGVTVFADRLDPEAWVDDSDLDLLPGVPTRLVLTVARPITAEELSEPGVLQTLNEIVGVLSRSPLGANLGV